MTDCDDPMPPMMVGSAEAESIDDDDEYPVAMLWLPNPEYERGWETRRVSRKKPPAPRRWTGLVP